MNYFAALLVLLLASCGSDGGSSGGSETKIPAVTRVNLSPACLGAKCLVTITADNDTGKLLVAPYKLVGRASGGNAVSRYCDAQSDSQNEAGEITAVVDASPMVSAWVCVFDSTSGKYGQGLYGERAVP